MNYEQFLEQMKDDLTARFARDRSNLIALFKSCHSRIPCAIRFLQ